MRDSLRIYLTVLCAIVVQPAIAQDAPQPDVTSLAVSATVVPRPSPVDLQNQYIRLIAVVPKTPIVLRPSDRAFLEQLQDWLIDNYFVAKQRSLLVSVKTMVGPDAISQQTIFHQLQSHGAIVDRYYSNTVLTPFMLGSPDPLKLEIFANYKTEVSSKAATTLVSTLSSASSLLHDPTNVLTVFTKKSFGDTAKAVDKALAAIIGASASPSAVLDFDPTKHERIDLVVAPTYGKPMTLLSIIVDARESLIAPTGSKSNYPILPDDITKHKIHSPSDISIAEFVNTHPNLSKNSKLSNLGEIADFCRTLGQSLAEAGLNPYDRASSLYAYLVNSGWNADYGMRDGAQDECEPRVAVLTGTNLARLLHDRSELEPSVAIPSASFKKLFKIRVITPLTQALASTGADRESYWQDVLADQVGITTLGEAIKLNGDGVLQPTQGLVKDVFDVVGLLSANTIAWKDSPDCFTPFRNTQKTARFRARAACTNVTLKDGSVVPADVEFEYDDKMDDRSLHRASAPRITQIKFIPHPAATAATAATVAAAAPK